ncbi:hypothetical protein B9Z45_15270 [Limnohabitans sp. 2KL-17]|nr:hypothetical protein B9Z45_15270 [Limnohabitans sp. 2KL-17]
MESKEHEPLSACRSAAQLGANAHPADGVPGHAGYRHRVGAQFASVGVTHQAVDRLVLAKVARLRQGRGCIFAVMGAMHEEAFWVDGASAQLAGYEVPSSVALID